MWCQMHCFFVLNENALFCSRTSNSSLAGSQLELHVLGRSLYHCVDLWVGLCANDFHLRAVQSSEEQGTGWGVDTVNQARLKSGSTNFVWGLWYRDTSRWAQLKPFWFLLSLLIKCRKAQSCSKCALNTLMPWGQQAKHVSQSFNFFV